MNVRLMDTTIMLNLLDVPGRSDDREVVRKEFSESVKRGDVLILPIATVIETGNAISQIDGSKRHSIAESFATYLSMTVERKTPWRCDFSEITEEDLHYYSENFQSFATRGIGMGDLSIIKTYEKCRDNLPIDCIEIWSTDKHLSGYRTTEVYKAKRRKKIT